jgi:prepilin-type processing-associated H-X9-DG protein
MNAEKNTTRRQIAFSPSLGTPASGEHGRTGEGRGGGFQRSVPIHIGIQRFLRYAFSMVELLTVIGIIAVLIAILMPVLSKARQSSQLLVCKSNLHQIYQAGMMFASDHHGFLQFAGKANGANSAAPTDIFDPQEIHYAYYDDTVGRRPIPLPVALAPYLGSKIRVDSAADMTTDFESSSCLARRVFTCPAQLEMIPGQTVSDEAGWYAPRLSISYAYNEGVTGFENSTDIQISTHRLRGQFSKAIPSSEVFFMTDAVPRGGVDSSFYIAWFPSDSGRSTLGDIYSNSDGGTTDVMDTQFDHVRHHGKINVVYFDGHVDTLEIISEDLERAVILSK